MRALYSVFAAAIYTFTIFALLALASPSAAAERAIEVHFGPVTVLSVEEPPVIVEADDRAVATSEIS